MENIAVVGAGLSGAVVARELARSNHKIIVFDERQHVAGNCHTSRDSDTNVMVHVYGPHVFHTNNEKIWGYVQQFDEFMPFINRVKSVYNGRVYSLPINLMTINAFYGKALSPKDAAIFMETIIDKTIDEPQNFEEQALRFVGKDLYEAFFKGYTQKQWGVHPRELPATILKRLPIRFNYDDNYYASRYQGIPKNGYTYIIERLLDHPNIDVRLNVKVHRNDVSGFDHVFYSGPIDAWFGYSEGRLGYRTLDFVMERHDGDFQGTAVMNYGNEDVPFTRISEHKHFTPWERNDKTLIYREYSRLCGDGDVPYYPVRLTNNKAKLGIYVEKARREKNLTLIGRLGTYRYLDMGVTIEEALRAAECFIVARSGNSDMPAFCIDPL